MPNIVLIHEPCELSSHLTRELRANGHTVERVPLQYPLKNVEEGHLSDRAEELIARVTSGGLLVLMADDHREPGAPRPPDFDMLLGAAIAREVPVLLHDRCPTISAACLMHPLVWVSSGMGPKANEAVAAAIMAKAIDLQLGMASAGKSLMTLRRRFRTMAYAFVEMGSTTSKAAIAVVDGGVVTGTGPFICRLCHQGGPFPYWTDSEGRLVCDPCGRKLAAETPPGSHNLVAVPAVPRAGTEEKAFEATTPLGDFIQVVPLLHDSWVVAVNGTTLGYRGAYDAMERIARWLEMVLEHGELDRARKKRGPIPSPASRWPGRLLYTLCMGGVVTKANIKGTSSEPLYEGPLDPCGNCKGFINGAFLVARGKIYCENCMGDVPPQKIEHEKNEAPFEVRYARRLVRTTTNLVADNPMGAPSGHVIPHEAR